MVLCHPPASVGSKSYTAAIAVAAAAAAVPSATAVDTPTGATASTATASTAFATLNSSTILTTCPKPYVANGLYTFDTRHLSTLLREQIM